MRIVALVFMVGATMSVAFAAIAEAQVHCFEGKTASGECVNPRLASVMRKQAIILSQPKISDTTPLNLPSEDAFYPRLQDRFENRVFFGSPALVPGGF
ncbi:MAG TPA: hypothetical protein VKS24_06570 [Bradyrhizobium sp.]|nr:hypothetical protein [Bradyrhizobium sp.]